LVIFQKRVPDLTELALARFLARARRAAGLKAAVNVLLTTSAEMKFLNRRFRGKDKPTDVLSFPAEPEASQHSAGEIAISAEIATKNGFSLGHSPAEEVKILVLHGVCICAVTITSATMGRWRSSKNSCAQNSTFPTD